MITSLFSDLSDVKRKIDAGALRNLISALPVVPDLINAAIPDLTKVGPEGYIHGWICVRPPCGHAGDVVSHVMHGKGVITSAEGDDLHAKFSDGRTGVLGREVARVNDDELVKNAAANDDGTVTAGKKLLGNWHEDEPSPFGKRFIATSTHGAQFFDASDDRYGVSEDNARKSLAKQLKDAHNKYASQVIQVISDAKAGGYENPISIMNDYPRKVNLSADEKRAIDQYGSDSLTLNSYLRGKPVENDTAEYDISDHIEHDLDGAVAKYSLPGKTLLYRGATISLPDDSVGKVISDKAFVSTSFSKSEAMRFVKSVYELRGAKGSKKVLFRITAPGGTHGALIGNSSFDSAEFLLPRSSSFRITGQSKLKGGIIMLDAEVIR
jgi:hypothetical protein